MLVEISDESLDEIVVAALTRSLQSVEDEELEEAIHTVIAYHSVPGTYLDGTYDVGC